MSEKKQIKRITLEMNEAVVYEANAGNLFVNCLSLFRLWFIFAPCVIGNTLRRCWNGEISIWHVIDEIVMIMEILGATTYKLILVFFNKV